MRKISIILPPRYRLEVKLTKTREGVDIEPFLPDVGRIMRARKGNKVSRFFRHIFEHSKAKKILPAYFAAMVMASVYMPNATPTLTAAEVITTPHKTAQPVVKTQSGIQYPVTTIKITQRYSFYHPGYDLDGLTGDPIYPIMAGKVETTEYSKIGYGLSVIVNHGNGFSSRYAHLSKITVNVGDSVDIHTELGKMGATGRSFGDHLHLEIYEFGKAVNPYTVLPK